jgi:bifunctional non-homologous end joining protein LigD
MLARYLPPAAPTLRSTPPRGEQWLHEVKFDGWRIQLHKHGDSAAAFTKNGHDHSSRERWMVDALARLKGVRSLIIDGELVACDHVGLPDFYRLHFHRRDRGLCVWAFDLLHHNGRDLRELPLFERKARLEKLILVANANWGHLKVCALNNANSDKMRTCDHSTERQVSVPAAQHIVRFLGYC